MYQEQKNTSNTFRYDAFISYRHLEEDNEIAQTLQSLLEKYVIMDPITNKKRHIKVFRDQSELPVSDDLGNEILCCQFSKQGDCTDFGFTSFL